MEFAQGKTNNYVRFRDGSNLEGRAAIISRFSSPRHVASNRSLRYGIMPRGGVQSQALTLNSAEIRVSYLGRLLRDNDALPRFIRNTVGETIPGVETRRSVARRVPILVELPTFRRPSGKSVQYAERRVTVKRVEHHKRHSEMRSL